MATVVTYNLFWYQCNRLLSMIVFLSLIQQKHHLVGVAVGNEVLLPHACSLVPRPLPMREKGLVHTDCTCARLSENFP